MQDFGFKKWEQLDKNKPHYYYLTKFTAAVSFPSNSRISISRGKWKPHPIGGHQKIQGIWKEHWRDVQNVEQEKEK